MEVILKMQITLNWYEPITLGSSQILEQTIEDFDLLSIPKISGVYIFYREFGDYREALYVGQSENLRIRIKAQFNNRKLIKGLKETRKGQKKLIFAEVKTLGNLSRALMQAEKGLINNLDTRDHPLLNRQLLEDQYDYITCVGHVLDIVDDEMAVFYPKK